ncbi:peptidoglycan-binding domain-containing protein [Microlunatus soli]|uniref:Peptidoglycan-binding (PGRP) domain of peptidoglycan hydrolases-containing protein n=1 Tax=Microlunatus soli TaxID=630515 RepID=A0A1H1VNS5_9ACTN|nr:peptidoglycan-binding protein [Microlunatus soli]SDS86537.1 Peptidoglycan-binding (PGRP) domain of peptidoglycan hydrolases-containing protein [Microlunatus soli]
MIKNSRLITAAISITLAGAALGSAAGTATADPVPEPKSTASVSSSAKHVPATEMSKAQVAAAGGTYASVADDGVLQRLDGVADARKINGTLRLALFETAWVESRANNLPWGDRDSLGVFQQRPSMGWGSAAQVQDPVYAANKFLDGTSDHAGAIKVQQRHPSYPSGTIAQKVQGSAFPTRYQEAAGTAKALVARADGIRNGTVKAGSYNWPMVQAGEKNDRVMGIQLLLRAHGYSLAADGSFGPGTKSTVQAFQKKSGLAADGVVGPNTWKKLIIGVPGGNSWAVKAAQVQLKASGYTVNTDGRYTQTTKNAVASFRRNYRLPAGTIVDTAVWNTLIAMHL